MTIVVVYWHISIFLSLALFSLQYNKYLIAPKDREDCHTTFLHIIHIKLFRTTNSVLVSIQDLPKKSFFFLCSYDAIVDYHSICCSHISSPFFLNRRSNNIWIIKIERTTMISSKHIKLFFCLPFVFDFLFQNIYWTLVSNKILTSSFMFIPSLIIFSFFYILTNAQSMYSR
jgi:hypothetical protein